MSIINIRNTFFRRLILITVALPALVAAVALGAATGGYNYGREMADAIRGAWHGKAERLP